MTQLDRQRILRDGAHLKGMVARCQAWVLAEALVLTRGNRHLAARLLGIGRNYYYNHRAPLTGLRKQA